MIKMLSRLEVADNTGARRVRMISRLGHATRVCYLGELGRGYFEQVNRQWREGGLNAVALYWRAFFAAEPGSVVNVIEQPDRVVVEVQICPAIKHLREGGREIVGEFCKHCYHLGSARAEAAGLTMRLKGCNGSCQHTFASPEAGLPPQDMQVIEEARS